MSWRRFFRRNEWDRERARELEAHLEIEADRNISSGMREDEARFAANRKLGNTTQIREEVFRMNSIGFLETLWQDVRFGLRSLRKSPGLTLVIMLSLALGTGANTAIFTLVDAALLRLLPVRDPQQLVNLTVADPVTGAPTAFSYPAYQEIRDQSKAFSALFTYSSAGLTSAAVGVDGKAGIAKAELVSGNYFSALGINPLLGRLISPDDDRVPNGNPVAVISYSYWTTRFNRDPSVIGKAVTINNSPFTIVGVVPPEFFGLQPGASIHVWAPITTVGQVRPDMAMPGTPNFLLTQPNRNWLPILGRVKPDISPDRALADVGIIYEDAKRIRAAAPYYTPKDRERIMRMRLGWQPASRGMDALRQLFSKPLAILMVVVGLLLLITCANVANLLLARASTRQTEIGVRIALGAGRGRLIRQLMTESVLLALFGGALGMLVAFWGSKSLLALMSPSATPIPLNVQPDARVFGFTILVSFLTSILFGIVPAWRTTRVDLATGLKEGARGQGNSRGRSRLGKVLVISQVALSLVLLVGAGLLVRTLNNLKNIYPGFDENDTLLISVNPSLAGYKGDQYIELFKKLLDRVRAVPGVQTASFSLLPPMTQGAIGSPPKIQGYTPKNGENEEVQINYVGPDYFSTIGMPILLGRGITLSDQMGGPDIVVVNQTFAKTYFGDSNPIGRRFSANTDVVMEIVGVVQDAKYHDPRDKNLPFAYVPFFQLGNSGVINFEIRTPLNPTSILPSIRQQIESVDSRIPILNTSTLVQLVNQSFVQERLVASLTSLFGILALLLAAVGLYGLMAYTVTRRTNEIGIRMALGAQRGNVIAMVLREIFVLVAIGLAIGIPASIVASRLIASELYGLTPGDPLTIATAMLIMICAAVFAGFLPARRASRVDPLVALRYE